VGRRGIRGYRPDPVPRTLIEDILRIAMRAPSSMNTQPWNFYVITGEPLDRIRQGNTERMIAGVPQSREFRTGKPFAGPHRDRQIGVAKQLFSAMGIADDQVIMKSIALGWPDESFPATAVVSTRKSVDEAAVFVGFE